MLTSRHTRCWTLQELLAPEKVVFVDRAWHKVSNKETWLTELCTITGIAAGALENVSYVGGFTAADRFSWAATRRTTRVEDAAYSLLGVFGVNMPLLYGERHRAFERLCREILREIGDPTVLGHNGDTLYPDRAALFSKRSVTDNAISLYQPEELATWRSEAIPTSLDRGVLLRHIPYIRVTPDESEHHVIIALPAWKGSRMIGLERHTSWTKREWRRCSDHKLLVVYGLQAETENALARFDEHHEVTDEGIVITDGAGFIHPWESHFRRRPKP